MTFHSVLTLHEEPLRVADAPDYFADLNLDQIVTAITVSIGEYDLKPVFNAPLTDADEIEYRHEVMRDLENESVLQLLKAFATKMRSMRERLAQSEKMHYLRQKEGLFLEAIAIYCAAMRALCDDLHAFDLASRGLRGFRQHLDDYLSADPFRVLLGATDKLRSDLHGIRYCLLIGSSMLTVTKYEAEKDYGEVIQGAFEKFRQGEATRHVFKFPEWAQMNHIEAGVLDRVARLNPETFRALDAYYVKNRNCVDATVRAFEREIHFYIAYADYIAPLKQAGLQFCYPVMSRRNKAISVSDTFDAALAGKLVKDGRAIVRNDFHLDGIERIFIVSGPNQGGKTTFARTFGQLHHLGAIGLPVPGASAQLFLFDKILTQFEREENIHNLRGKLQDDLVRIHDALQRATSNSIVIMNEIFNSTTLGDALLLSKNILKKLIRLDAICLCVTFIDELIELSDTAVSMVSNVVPDDPAARTYKIIRRRADGLAYAYSIAEKYRLTYAQLKERLTS